MRLILLEVCVGITALLFLIMLTRLALNRAAMSEYLWALVPWVMLAACALPAVRLIVAGH